MLGTGHLPGQSPASLFQDAAGLVAPIGRGGAVAAQHGETDGDLLHLAVPPAGQGHSSFAGRRFGTGHCPAELGARVLGEPSAVDSQEDVTHPEQALGGRSLRDLGDGNLPGIRGHQLVAEHPSAQAGGAQVPVMPGPLGKGIALGQIRDRQGLAPGSGTGGRRGGEERQKEERSETDRHG
jgi:hypothetical protein